MNNKNTATKEESLQTDFGTSLDLSDINRNTAAQEYLLQRSKEVSEEALFEEIYRNRQEHGVEMMRRRAMRRAYAAKNEIKDSEPSYLDTAEKEQGLYDLLAQEDTARLMMWLSKRKKQDKKR